MYIMITGQALLEKDELEALRELRKKAQDANNHQCWHSDAQLSINLTKFLEPKDKT